MTTIVINVIQIIKTNKRSNNFIQDEARKLQEEKDNDPYKY